MRHYLMPLPFLFGETTMSDDDRDLRWHMRLEAVLKRIRDRVGDVSEDQVEAAFRRARARSRARRKHLK